jgi:predicted nucleic-acid-binding protein
MIGLDTNLLIRYIIQDDPKQSKIAERIIESNCTNENPGWISTIVLCEFVWVIQGAYNYSKELIVSILYKLLSTSEIQVESASLVREALKIYEKESLDFSDILIGCLNHSFECSTTYTFDKKAPKNKYFTLAS